jgi:hypothetical protein
VCAADDEDGGEPAKAAGPAAAAAAAAAAPPEEDVKGPHTNLAVRLSRRDPNKKWLLGERLSYVLLTGAAACALCLHTVPPRASVRQLCSGTCAAAVRVAGVCVPQAARARTTRLRTP